MAPIGEALRSKDAVQSRLNDLVVAYNGVIADVSRRSGAYYISFFERFRDQLDRSAIVKPFTRFSFAAFYRDYLFREMILDAVSTKSRRAMAGSSTSTAFTSTPGVAAS